MKLQKRKFFFFYAGVLVALAFVLVFWIPLFVLTKGRFHFTRPATPFFRFFLPLMGIQVEVNGGQYLDEVDGGVILANHQSQLDIVLILAWVKNASFLAKAELFKIPVFASLLRLSGCLPVYRGSPEKNKALIYPLLKATQMGRFFCVFPEGTRSHHGEILPFKSGIFHYIKAGDLSVVPVYIHNAHQIWPKGLFKLKKGVVQIQILPPVRAKDYAGLEAVELRDQVRDQFLDTQRLFG